MNWTENLIREELLKSIDALQIERMPTAAELKSLGRNDLHCKVSRTKKYSGWAKELGLVLKESETTMGQKYEAHIKEIIESKLKPLEVKRMTTKYPYDLLVNNIVKIDVKVGKAHYHFGSRSHTFALNKKYPTCDLYICVALDEEDHIEKYFIIPSRFAQMITLNIGSNSKYNKYIDNWYYIINYITLSNRTFL